MAATLLSGVIAVPASMYASPSADLISAKESLSESDLKDIEGIAEYFNLTEQEKNEFIKAPCPSESIYWGGRFLANTWCSR